MFVTTAVENGHLGEKTDTEKLPNGNASQRVGQRPSWMASRTARSEVGGRGGATQRSGGRSEIVMAAAMQDHFLRNLNVSLPGMAPRRRKPAAATSRPENIAPLDAKDKSAQEAAKQLSLAQKLGLVPLPPAKLTQEEWQQVAAQSRQRDDSTRECPICMDTFRTEAQVILSCSHVFHAACLASFERFAGKASCPLCRSANYEKRLFEEGRKNWELLCARKVQAVWRGHCGRKIWNHLLDTVVPSDPAKRRDFFARRMGKLTFKLLSALDDNADDIDALFAESERALAASREVFNPSPPQISAARAAAAAPRDTLAETSTADRWAALRLDLEGSGVPASSGQPGSAAMQEEERDAVDWGEVEAAALCRNEQDCAICLGDLGGPDKRKALTSCSHLFHAVCLASFERFASAVSADRHRQNLEDEPKPDCPKCPCCRADYTKRLY